MVIFSHNNNTCVFTILLLTQYTHPNETESYRETARAIRMIGKDCIERRIRATENGEKVPNDVLSRILERTSKRLITVAVHVCNDSCEDVLKFSQFSH